MHRTVNKMSTAVQKILVNFQFNLILESKEIFGVGHSSFVKTYTKPSQGCLSQLVLFSSGHILIFLTFQENRGRDPFSPSYSIHYLEVKRDPRWVPHDKTGAFNCILTTSNCIQQHIHMEIYIFLDQKGVGRGEPSTSTRSCWLPRIIPSFSHSWLSLPPGCAPRPAFVGSIICPSNGIWSDSC